MNRMNEVHWFCWQIPIVSFTWQRTFHLLLMKFVVRVNKIIQHKYMLIKSLCCDNSTGERIAFQIEYIMWRKMANMWIVESNKKEPVSENLLRPTPIISRNSFRLKESKIKRRNKWCVKKKRRVNSMENGYNQLVH